MRQADIGSYAVEHGWQSASHVEGSHSSLLTRGPDRLFLYFDGPGSDAQLRSAEDLLGWASADVATIQRRLT